MPFWLFLAHILGTTGPIFLKFRFSESSIHAAEGSQPQFFTICLGKCPKFELKFSGSHFWPFFWPFGAQYIPNNNNLENGVCTSQQPLLMSNSMSKINKIHRGIFSKYAKNPLKMVIFSIFFNTSVQFSDICGRTTVRIFKSLL